VLSPFEDRDLLQFGYGLTNIVARATARADELKAEELILGQQQLAVKVQQYQPQFIAFLGISAYRTAFDRPKAVIGRQDELLSGATIWVLPNPSGLNAHYQLAELKQVYRELLLAVSN
jgi:double-stranded uracil-DNA glycosylase